MKIVDKPLLMWVQTPGEFVKWKEKVVILNYVLQISQAWNIELSLNKIYRFFNQLLRERKLHMKIGYKNHVLNSEFYFQKTKQSIPGYISKKNEHICPH